MEYDFDAIRYAGLRNLLHMEGPEEFLEPEFDAIRQNKEQILSLMQDFRIAPYVPEHYWEDKDFTWQAIATEAKTRQAATNARYDPSCIYSVAPCVPAAYWADRDFVLHAAQSLNVLPFAPLFREDPEIVSLSLQQASLALTAPDRSAHASKGDEKLSLTTGEDYAQATKNPFQGKTYYDTGELRYEGGCVKLSGGRVCPCGMGTGYYRSGVIKEEGLFQRRGLVCGRMYYPSGKLRFEGYCREPAGYGPAYPTQGCFYGEDGQLLYKGAFQITAGGVGYPRVVVPEGFGPLS